MCVCACARMHACVRKCICALVYCLCIYMCVLCVCDVWVCMYVYAHRIMGNFRILIFTTTNANQTYLRKWKGSALPFTLLHYENLFSKNGSEFSNYSKVTRYKVCCVACLFMCLHESIV